MLHALAGTSPLRLSELTATEQVIHRAITQLVTRVERDGRLGAEDREAIAAALPAPARVAAEASARG